MPSFFVDPLLCTIPTEGATSEEIIAWLLALDGWLSAVETSPFIWKNATRCSEILVMLGRFPHFDALRRLRATANIDINIGRLIQRINSFFQDESRDLHTAIPTQVALPESIPLIEPGEFLERNISEIRGPLAETLLCLALDKSRDDRFAREAQIVTRSFIEERSTVTIRAEGVEVDPPYSRESTIANSFLALFSPRDLSAFHYESVLAGGENILGDLIREVAEKTHRDSTFMTCTIGLQFWRSLRDTGMIDDRFAVEKTLKICAAILAGRHDELDLERRPIRKTEAPDAPQRTRKSDDAKAWRITITKHGAGYRLHYWAVVARDEKAVHVEFANIARERDRPVLIPE